MKYRITQKYKLTYSNKCINIKISTNMYIYKFLGGFIGIKPLSFKSKRTTSDYQLLIKELINIYATHHIENLSYFFIKRM